MSLSQAQLSKAVAANKDPSQLKSSTPITWHNHHQRAIEKLMHTVTSPPLLSYPDFHQPFILYVNASTKGLGCSLYQQNWGKFYVLGLVEELYQNQKRGITVQSWNSWHLIEQFSVISENMFHIHQRVRLTLATTLLFIFWNQQSLAQQINCGWMSWLV